MLALSCKSPVIQVLASMPRYLGLCTLAARPHLGCRYLAVQDVASPPRYIDSGTVAVRQPLGCNYHVVQEFPPPGYLDTLAASNREGELYVCDTGNHRIQVHSTRDGTFLRSFGGKGDAPGQFRKPAAIAVLDPKTSSGGGASSSRSRSSGRRTRSSARSASRWTGSARWARR